jgi:hypothetical protein
MNRVSASKELREPGGGAIELAAFLSDLCAELARASQNARNDLLKLAANQVTVSLDVGVTKGRKGGVSAGARAKF